MQKRIWVWVLLVKKKLVLKDSLRFSRWEDEAEEIEAGTSTSTKGKFDRSQPNDRTVKIPLKKQKNKCEKLPFIHKVSTSTKT
jgi:hypothetical protein